MLSANLDGVDFSYNGVSGPVRFVGGAFVAAHNFNIEVNGGSFLYNFGGATAAASFLGDGGSFRSKANLHNVLFIGNQSPGEAVIEQDFRENKEDQAEVNVYSSTIRGNISQAFGCEWKTRNLMRVSRIVNSLIVDNGAVDDLLLANEIINSTIYNNYSIVWKDPVSHNEVPAFRILSGSPIFKNSILWQNNAMLSALDVEKPDLLIRKPTNSTIDDVHSGNSIVYSDDPVNLDIPKIVEVDENTSSNYNNYHLRLNSPARDAGDTSFIQAEDILTDIDGKERIFDDRNPATTDIVDMGAYEYQGVRKPIVTITYAGEEKGIASPANLVNEVPFGSDFTFSVMPSKFGTVYEIRQITVDKGSDDEDIFYGYELPSWTASEPYGGKVFILYDVIKDHTLEVLIAQKDIPFKVTIASGLGIIRNELDGILLSLADEDGGPVSYEYTVPYGENTSLYFQPAPGWRTKQVSVIADMKEPVIDTDNPWSKKITNVQVPYQVVVEFAPCEDLEPLKPSYVKTITHPSDGIDLVSYTVPDGFGRPVQSQSYLNDGEGRTIVSGGYFDPAGRSTHTVMPFVHEGPLEEFEFLPMGCKDLIRRANLYYDGENDENGVPLPDAEGFAFSETRYRTAPGTSVDKTGAPGKLRSADSHTARSWAFGVETSESFLTFGQMNESDLNNRFESQNIESPDMPYILSVTKDIDGKYSQAISDKFGNVLNVWSNPDQENDLAAVTSQSEYDILGRNVVTHYPQVPGQSPQQAVTTFNMRGQSVSSEDPDRNATEFRYNRNGQLRFSRNAMQRTAGSDPNIGYFTVTNYDDLGRVVSMGINITSAAQFDSPDLASIRGDEKIKKYYDRITEAQIMDMGVDGAMALRISGEVRNLYGNLAGSVTYTEDARAIGEIFSYYPSGQLEASYKIIPVIGKVQKFAYEYDAKGEVVARKYFNGYAAGAWSEVSRKEFVKDDLGRVVSVKENGGIFVTYTHNRVGDMQNKKFFAKGSGTPLKEVNYVRDIDGLKSIAADASHPGFRQNILYRDPVAPATFGGQVYSNEYIYRIDVGAVSTELNKYEYDDTHRLDKVMRWSEDDETFFEYGAYTYDQMGRFVSKKEGGTTLADYEYVDGKNQLNRISGDSRRNSSNGNFVYDLNGNMVLDRSKKMTVDYDWRGMAVRYRFFSQIPDEALDWDDVYNGALAGRTGISQVSLVEMEFNRDGQRVLKTDATATDKITAYIGDLAVFEGIGPGAMNLSYVNFVTAGGVTGKKEMLSGNENEYFFIKDNLGSTRLVVKSDGNTQEINSFESYGELTGLSLPPESDGSVKELFTGKELDTEGPDGGMSVYYFGARFYDPELGGWLTPDPAGQFLNPYSYGGDPINGVDRDGQCIDGISTVFCAMAAGAAYGAIFGGGVSYVSHSLATNDWSLNREALAAIGQGAFVGGVTGAITGGFGAYAPPINQAGATFAGRYGWKIGYAAISGFASGVGGYTANVYASSGYKNLNEWEPVDAGIAGGVGGAIGAGLAYGGALDDYYNWYKLKAGTKEDLLRQWSKGRDVGFQDEKIDGIAFAKTDQDGGIMYSRKIFEKSKSFAKSTARWELARSNVYLGLDRPPRANDPFWGDIMPSSEQNAAGEPVNSGRGLAEGSRNRWSNYRAVQGGLRSPTMPMREALDIYKYDIGFKDWNFTGQGHFYPPNQINPLSIISNYMY